MGFETLSLIWIGIALLLLFGAAQFGVCFVRRNGLRKTLRTLAFLPFAAVAAYILWVLVNPHRGTGFIDDGLFAAALVGIPALFALVGSAAGWLIGRAVKKKKAAA